MFQLFSTFPVAGSALLLGYLSASSALGAPHPASSPATPTPSADPTSPSPLPSSAPPGEPAPAAESDTTPSIVPPHVVTSVAAIYPEPALRARQTGYVELLVTVLEDGRVSDVTVAQSAGAAFDAAAIDAVRAWRFSPAQRSGAAVASRIRVPFEFVPPALLPAPFPPAEAAPASPSAPPSPPAPDTEHDHDDAVDVTVHGQRQLRTETRSVSDFRIERDVLAAAPRQEGIDVLKTAPGLYIGRGEGAALGHHYMLRGFDAEHGQDIEFRVGGLPINQRSHIHGQGYADLGFLIGESVSELRVSEGVYDPRQGDFAVAGSINVDLGVEEERRGVTLKSSYGAFDTTRHLALWAPRGAAEETLGAVQLTRSAGFGENRAGSAGSGVFQQRFGEGDHSYRAVGIAHAARSDMAGVLRQADVDSGAVCFGCVYDLPTARAQNAATSRLMVGLFADTTSNAQGNGQLGVWLGADDFRVQQNFTGFVERSSTLPGVAGRGDLIEQQNRTLSAGVTGRYRTSRFRPAAWAHGTVEVGADARLDDIEQAQRLIEAGRNETWDERVDASVLGVDLGVWGDLDWVIAKQIHLRAGLRADVLSYQINDRLGNFVELSRPQDSFIVGFRRSALGLAWGPRTSLEVHLSEALSLLTAYGEGYRSPQARQLEDGEPAPFTKVRSGDLGAHLDLDDALHLALGGYATRLSDDAAFDAGTDRLERTGATQRLGGVAQVVARPAPWLVGAASVTFVRATLLEPSPATTEEPQPAFQAGQALPFVPPLVVRADVGARHILFDNAGGRALGGRAGVGWSFLSPRPLPYAQSANAVNLLDTSIGLSWASAELTFELFNALDAEYAAVEYNFASDWAPDDDVRPRTPARHIAAGGPRTWLVSLGVTL